MPHRTLDELTTKVRQLPKDALLVNPLDLLPEVLSVKNELADLLEFESSPKMPRELYYLNAITCALIEDMKFSLGFTAPSLFSECITQAKAINYDSLLLHCKLRKAQDIAAVGRPQAATAMVFSATPLATDSITRTCLFSEIAYYSALSGRCGEARTYLRRTQDSYEHVSGTNDLFDDIGGVFRVSRASLLHSWGETYLTIGDYANAETTFEEALHSMESRPAKERPVGKTLCARINLAHSQLFHRDIDTAVDTLQPVFAIPTWQKFSWVLRRMRFLYRQLRNQDAVASGAGQQLAEQIEEFLRTTTLTGSNVSGLTT